MFFNYHFQPRAPTHRYDENGNTLGIPEFEPPKPKRLAFDLDHAVALDAIQEAHLASQQLLNVSFLAVNDPHSLKLIPRVPTGCRLAHLRARRLR